MQRYICIRIQINSKMYLNYAKLLLCLFLAWVTSLPAQNTFYKTIGGAGNETGTWVISTGDGYLISGYVSSASGNQDALLVRVDNQGEIIWQKKFGGGSSEQFNGVVVLSDGYLAYGETQSYGAGGSDMFLVKVDGNGNILWSKTIGESAYTDLTRYVLTLDDGGVILSGASAPTGSNAYNSTFTRMDAAGNILWAKKYSSPVSNICNANLVRNDTIFLSGGMDSEAFFGFADLQTGYLYDGWLYSGTGTEALYYMQFAEDGNPVIADHTHSALTGEDVEFWAQKVDASSGQVIWSKVYYRTADNLRGHIEKIQGGGFLLVPYDNGNTNTGDALLVKIDGNGNLIWSYNYGGAMADRLLKAFQTDDGGFIAVGDTRSYSSNGSSDILLLKTDAGGQIANFCALDGKIKTADFNTSAPAPVVNIFDWVQPEPLNLTPQNLTLQSATSAFYQRDTVSKTIDLCPDEAFHFHGVDYFAPQTINYTNPNVVCDTLFIYHLELQTNYAIIHTVKLCPGESVNINGEPYFAPATVLDSVIHSLNTCDTLVLVQLVALNSSRDSLVFNVCPGEEAFFNGIHILTGTTQQFSYLNSGGCDSTIIVTARAVQASAATVFLQACPQEQLAYHGLQLAAGDTASLTITNVAGCDSVITVVVSESPPTAFSVLPQVSCENASTGILEVDSLSGGPAPYHFSLDQLEYQDSARFIHLAPGSYQVFVKDANGCVFSQNTFIETRPKLDAYLNNAILPCDSSGVTIRPNLSVNDTQGLDFVWSTGATTDAIVAAEAGKIWVEVSDQCGKIRSEAEVNWDELPPGQGMVYVPNIFEPSASRDENTRFRPYFPDGVNLLSFHFEVYSRWGELIFESSAPDQSWDGIFRGKPFNPGVLVWHLEAEIGVCGRVLQVRKKGDVSLIR